MVEIGECLKKTKAEGLNREETLFRLATEVEEFTRRGSTTPQRVGRRGVSHEGRGPGAVQEARRGPGSVAAGGARAVRQHGARQADGGDSRGCTRGCRFCQPGMLTRPARDVPPEKVVEAVEKGMRETGYNEFSLLSLSCSDYLALPSVGLEIKNRLRDENGRSRCRRRGSTDSTIPSRTCSAGRVRPV